MLDIGGWEILLILVLTLLVVGPEQLPRVAKGLGRVINTIRRLAAEFQFTLEESVREEEDAKRRQTDRTEADKAASEIDAPADDPYGLEDPEGTVPAGGESEAKTRPDAEPITDSNDDPAESEKP